MTDTTTLGPYLRRERERRGLTLRVISENTKVSLALLEGLEADDISRWPGGIFRRAFVRSYAQCVGLDPGDIFRRFEEQFRPVEPEPAVCTDLPLVQIVQAGSIPQNTRSSVVAAPPGRSRIIGTAADLTVALVLAFGSAAAGSRLLWPVLLIAAYYAAGILLTGTSPMVALLSDQSVRVPQPDRPRGPVQAAAQADSRQPRRTGDAPLSHRRGMQPGVS